MSEWVEPAVDQLLLEQGEYLPLEYLLQEGRLSYADYEAWRDGELALLDQALFGDAQLVGRQLAKAELYLQRRGFQVEPLRYQPWRPPDAASATSRALRFSANREFNEAFHRRYVRPQEQPQMDLFTDAPATNLVNGIVQCLTDRDPLEARRLLERLYKVAPDHNRLGELERLTEGAEVLHDPVEDLAAEFRWLHETLAPMAVDLLGSASHNLLVPLWRRLSAALRGRPYDRAAPNLHLSYTAAQALDSKEARWAVEHEPEWQSDVVLLLRHARACESLQEVAAALLSWFMVCWRFPEQAQALESSTHFELRQHWLTFQDLDSVSAVESFPAWLLVRSPGLTRTLPAPDPKSCPESYQTVYTLQHDHVQSNRAPGADNIALRAQLKQQDPELFKQFIGSIRT